MLPRQALHSEECGCDLVVPGYRRGRAATSPRGQPSGEMHHVDAKSHPYLSHPGPRWPHGFRIPGWGLRPISPEVEPVGEGDKAISFLQKALTADPHASPVQCRAGQRHCPAGWLALLLSIPWRRPWAKGVFQAPPSTSPLQDRSPTGQPWWSPAVLSHHC